MRRTRVRSLLRASFVLPGLLAGCHGLYVHDADRAKVASLAKQSVDAVNVASIAKTEQENLAKILSEEVKSIDQRAKLVAMLATIQLAASDYTIAQHYAQSQTKIKTTIGTDDILKLRELSDCRIKKQAAEESITALKKIFKASQVNALPSCQEAVSDTAIKPQNADDAEWMNYRDQCKAVAATCQITTPETAQLIRERSELSGAGNSAKNANASFEAARNEYKAAVAANQGNAQKGSTAERNIRQKAQELLDKFNQLANISPSVANRVKGSALVDLLTAAASGKKDPSADQDLAPALEIAKSVPALVGSVEKAKAAREIVPVSHLLIALNDLSIQSDRDARIAALRDEEMDVLERKLAIRNTQADLWRRYSDQLCNLALLTAGQAHPGKSCATLSFTKSTANGVTCEIKFTADASERPRQIDNCVLGQTWRKLFDADLSAPQKRALYEAAAAYLHVRLLAYATTVEDFRHVDVRHRASVINREAALSQWRNLVAVPTEELNGYYSGGVKPAELADLIVKALGFTAIAVGVAQ